MANRLKVTICNQSYTLVSEDAPAYIERIAALTDEKIAEVKKRNPALSTYQTAILTALNFADDLEKVKLIAREKVDSQAAEIRSLKEQLKALQEQKPPKKK